MSAADFEEAAGPDWPIYLPEGLGGGAVLVPGAELQPSQAQLLQSLFEVEPPEWGDYFGAAGFDYVSHVAARSFESVIRVNPDTIERLQIEAQQLDTVLDYSQTILRKAIAREVVPEDMLLPLPGFDVTAGPPADLVDIGAVYQEPVELDPEVARIIGGHLSHAQTIQWATLATIAEATRLPDAPAAEAQKQANAAYLAQHPEFSHLVPREVRRELGEIGQDPRVPIDEFTPVEWPLGDTFDATQYATAMRRIAGNQALASAIMLPPEDDSLMGGYRSLVWDALVSGESLPDVTGDPDAQYWAIAFADEMGARTHLLEAAAALPEEHRPGAIRRAEATIAAMEAILPEALNWAAGILDGRTYDPEQPGRTPALTAALAARTMASGRPWGFKKGGRTGIRFISGGEQHGVSSQPYHVAGSSYEELALRDL